MLIQDLLVTLPGLLGSASRIDGIDAARQSGASSTSLLVAQPAASQTLSLSGSPAITTAPLASFDQSPFDRASATTGPNLLDFYQAQKIDFDNPVAPDRTSPPVDQGAGETPGDPDGIPVDPVPDPGETPVDPDPVPDPGGAPDLSVDLTTEVQAEAGRVLTITPPDADAAIDNIRILSQSDHGQVSVNPDNTLALVLSEDPGNTDPTDFSYEITYQNGATRTVRTDVAITEGTQQKGWSLGDYYMLEEGRDGKAVTEYGENHRKVYVTASDDGLSRAEIARAEGVSEKTVTAAWLAQRPEYGATPDKALNPDIGMELWQDLTAASKGPSSNWLLFERGQEYADVTRVVTRGSSGESALNPLVIGAYGEGSDPVIGGSVDVFQDPSSNVVVRDIDIDGMLALWGSNLLFDNVSFYGSGGSVQGIDRITIRNSDFVDIVRDEPVDGGDTWNPHINRAGGIYVSETNGLLLEQNLFDHNGWADGYDYNLSADSPMPPSMFSQNAYLDYNNSDVTFRDNITMRAASFGAQIRSGAFIEDNSFIDNNAAVNFLGGDSYNKGPLGHYTLMLDNLVTSAGHKRAAAMEGGLSIGIDNAGYQTALIGNIVAQLADPGNPAEIAEKSVNHNALKSSQDPAWDDTIIYNWATTPEGERRNPDANTAGLDPAILDATTIQNFAANLLGRETASIADLGDYLRDQADGRLDRVVDADLINAFFREGFGLSTELRGAEATLRFIPDDRGEGMRWDNRLNWDTGDLPGTQDGDSVDLGGNRALFGAQTVAVDDFVFGDYGSLKATSGRLGIEGGVSVAETGARLEIGNAGQVWMANYLDSDRLEIDLTGGRFANTGAFAGATGISLGGDGQALLATSGASFDLRDGSSITIAGSAAKAGFDGGDGGSAVLRMNEGADLAFTADETGFGKLAEFRSGAFDTSKVTSGIRLDGNLSIDLSEWKADPKAQKWVLVDVDQMIGKFDDLTITGMARNRDALVRVDYVSDTVTLTLSDNGQGSGRVRMVEAGEADFIDYSNDAALTSLWDDLHKAAPEISDLPI